MTPGIQGYYYGYQGKQAASDDVLPSKTWWNLLPGHALEESGRGKALFEAQGKEPPEEVKHPWWKFIKGTVLGGVAGGIAGAGVGSLLNRVPLRAGSTLGVAAGALTGMILALRSSLKRTHAEAKSLEEKGITPEVSEKARRLVEEKAKKNVLLHSLGGLFVGHVMHGRSSQLQTLMEKDPDKREFPTSPRLAAGLQLPLAITGKAIFPGGKLIRPAINSAQGALSVVQAREALKGNRAV